MAAPPVTLRDLARQAAASQPEAVAFVDATSAASLTFAAFDRRTDQVANALADRGVGKGHTVAVLAENSLAWPVCEMALAKLGAVCVPLNYRLAPGELAWQLSHSRAGMVIAGGNHLAAAQEALDATDGPRDVALLAIDVDLADTGIDAVDDLEALADAQPAERADQALSGRDPQRLMYTSATTGLPKGVLCPNVHICDNARTISANQLADMRPGDIYLAATPLTHMATGYTWPVLSIGATTVIARRYEPERLAALVERFRVTHTLLAPTMIVTLVQHLRDDPDAARRLREGPLRRLWYAGSSMPPAVAEEAEGLLGPILAQQYGFTELFSAARAMCATFLPPDKHVQRRGSCGRPLTGLEVEVIDEAGRPVGPEVVGEIVVRAVEPIGGYLDDEERTREAFGDGWIRPGDVGRFDADGYLYITDRIKDMIISGGFNVYSAEVENVLMQHPDVDECAVVGMPDPKWVEVPCAYVVARRGSTIIEDELIAWVRLRLAGFKTPKRVVVRDALPRSVTGKTLKRELRDEIERQLAGTQEPS